MNQVELPSALGGGSPEHVSVDVNKLHRALLGDFKVQEIWASHLAGVAGSLTSPLCCAIISSAKMPLPASFVVSAIFSLPRPTPVCDRGCYR